MNSTTRTRRRVVVDDTPLAAAIGGRIRRARLAAGLTQQQLAGDRYTKAYISALENGLAKPSMAALNYLAPRLGTEPAALLTDPDIAWRRLEADLLLAAGDAARALDAARELLDTLTAPLARAELLTVAAECLCRLERHDEAVRVASEASQLFAGLGREVERATAEYWLASAHFQADNLADARAILSALLARVRDGLAVGPDAHTRYLVAAAMVESSAGEARAALAYLEEARGIGSDLDDRRRGMFLSSLATAYHEAGDQEGAIGAGLQARALLRAAEADVEAGLIDNQLAMAYLANGNTERAAEFAQAAREAATGRGDDMLASHLADTQAQITLAAGDPEAAVELAGEALLIAARAGVDRAHVQALVTRGRAYAALGRHEDAAADFERAAGSLKDGQRPARRREILSAWADTLAALGRHDQAFALAREALGER